MQGPTIASLTSSHDVSPLGFGEITFMRLRRELRSSFLSGMWELPDFRGPNIDANSVRLVF